MAENIQVQVPMVLKPSVIVKEMEVSCDDENDHLKPMRHVLAVAKILPGIFEKFIKHDEENHCSIISLKDQLHQKELENKMLRETICSRDAEIDRLNKALSAKDIELKETKNKLCAAEASLAKALDELKKTKDKLCATEAELKTTKEKLCATEAELKTTKDKLCTTEAELKTTKDKLCNTEAELKTTKDKLKVAEEKLCKAETDLKEAKNKLREAEERVARLEKANKKVLADLEEANAGERAAIEQARKADASRDQAVKERNEEAASNGTAAFLSKPNRTRGDYYLDEVIYGGVNIRDQKVIDKLLNFANCGEAFAPTNELMGGDPWPRNTKTFTAVYAVGKKGPFRYISIKEGQKVRFE